MQRISIYQLFTLLCLYEIGSTIIFGFSSGAGKAAWIAVLISATFGVLINTVYYLLYRMNPGLTLVEWYPAQLGKWIGLPISWFFTLELIYDGARGLADWKILIPSTILPKTPILFIDILFSILIAYALFSGIEVIGRLGELFLPALFGVFFIQIILIISSGVIHLQYTKPILGLGWHHIFESVYPLGITQSFGQTIEFTLMWPLVDKQNKILKTTILATIICGIFIAVLDLFAVLVLGENTFAHSLFPIFRMIRVIGVGEFIANLDAVNVLFFLTTAFFKFSIHVWNALRGIQILTYSKSMRPFIIPVVILVLYMGMSMADNSAEHLTTGLKVVPNSLWFPLYYVLPIILFIVTFIRRRLKQRAAK